MRSFLLNVKIYIYFMDVTHEPLHLDKWSLVDYSKTSSTYKILFES
jgi:hypothetical protein